MLCGEAPSSASQPSAAGSPGSRPRGEQSSQLVPSALSACCSSPAALPVTLPGAARAGTVALCPLAASQGKQDGLGSLAPAAGGVWGGLCFTAHLAPPGSTSGSHSRAGDEGGGVWKKRQVGCVEASAQELCGEQKRQKSAPRSHPCHPLHCITPARATQRWGHRPQRATLSLLYPSSPLGRAAKPPPPPWLLVSFFCPCRTIRSVREAG